MIVASVFVIAAGPRAAEELLAEAKEKLKSAQFEEAERLVEEAARAPDSFPVRGRVLVLQGVLENILRRPVDALVLFTQAIRFDGTVELSRAEYGDEAARLFDCARGLAGGEDDEPSIRKLAASNDPPGWICPHAQLALDPPPPPKPVAPVVQPETRETDAPFPLRATLAGVSAASAVTGIVFAVLALRASNDVDRGIANGESRDAVLGYERRGREHAITADVLFIAGVAAGVAALVIED